jgi:methylmalonyl-CoA carboxyltransferase small subunit
MVLEAMKMETVITAPIAGKVAKVNAAVGDLVQGGQVLVEFE